jgi:hypothetical protein
MNRQLFILKEKNSRNYILSAVNLDEIKGTDNYYYITQVNTPAEAVQAFKTLCKPYLMETYLIRKEWIYTKLTSNGYEHCKGQLKAELSNPHNYTLRMAVNDFNYYYSPDTQTQINYTSNNKNLL